MKKVIVLISFLCGAFFVSAQQGNQQQRQQERWKPESTEWYHPVPPKVRRYKKTKTALFSHSHIFCTNTAQTEFV